MDPTARHSTRRHWELPSWLLSQAALEGARLVGARLAAEGLGRHHFSVLTALRERGQASQAELGRTVTLDRSDLHAVVAELDRRGAIVRARDESDRRRNVVTLTAEGEALLGRLDGEVDAAQSELLAPLSAAERRQLATLLTKVIGPGPGPGDGTGRGAAGNSDA